MDGRYGFVLFCFVLGILINLDYIMPVISVECSLLIDLIRRIRTPVLKYDTMIVNIYSTNLKRNK